MMRRATQFATALVLAVAPAVTAHAQRATALAAAVTRPVAPSVRHVASPATTIVSSSSQDTKVLRGALIGAGVGAALGTFIAIAGKSTGSGPDHSADSDAKVIIIPAAAVLGGLLGVIVSSRL